MAVCPSPDWVWSLFTSFDTVGVPHFEQKLSDSLISIPHFVQYIFIFLKNSDSKKLKNKFNVNNHAEVVEVTYNKNIISTEKLLMHFFESHDPTQINRQGNDIGTQYRSIILFSNEEQKKFKIIFLEVDL